MSLPTPGWGCRHGCMRPVGILLGRTSSRDILQMSSLISALWSGSADSSVWICTQSQDAGGPEATLGRKLVDLRRRVQQESRVFPGFQPRIMEGRHHKRVAAGTRLPPASCPSFALHLVLLHFDQVALYKQCGQSSTIHRKYDF